MRRGFVTLFAALMLVASCGGDEEPPAGTAEEGSPSSTSTSTSVVTSSINTRVDIFEYATHAQRPLMLDMYVPAEPGGAPIVLFLPGGGGMGTWVLEPLAEAGAIVFHVRSAQRAAEATTLLADHGAAARAQADSMACAIRFARARAAELGSDDPVVVLTSFSWVGWGT